MVGPGGLSRAPNLGESFPPGPQVVTYQPLAARCLAEVGNPKTERPTISLLGCITGNPGKNRFCIRKRVWGLLRSPPVQHDPCAQWYLSHEGGARPNPPLLTPSHPRWSTTPALPKMGLSPVTREAPFTARRSSDPSAPGPGLQRALLTPSDQNFPTKAQTPGPDASQPGS